MQALILSFRATLFYIGYVPSIVWFGGTGMLLAFLPYRLLNPYLLLWNRWAVRWLKWTCGLDYELSGAENLPNEPFVALCKHTSQWETFFLQYRLAPVSIVLKRELLRLPFFGWGLRLARPIAIDRGNPKQALRQIMEQGKNRLADDISILVFPEGTRRNAGKNTKYARSGASVAIAAGAPVVPIAHNAGEFWPAGSYIKYPGRVSVKIGPPIYPGREGSDSRVITEQARQWIEAEVAAMPKRAGRPDAHPPVSDVQR